MKRIALLLVGMLVLAACAREQAKNPDPNHTHADFAVWVEGKKIDFSGEQYMSGSSTDGSTHPTEGPRKYLHLHDGNGHVAHRHKPGLTFGDFLESLGWQIRDDAISIPGRNDVVNWEMGEEIWRLYVNGKLQESPNRSLLALLHYDFQDLDRLLLVYGDANENMDAPFDQMTDDACLYSHTCPWKGDPPTENCIADPEVPCVAQ